MMKEGLKSDFQPGEYSLQDGEATRRSSVKFTTVTVMCIAVISAAVGITIGWVVSSGDGTNSSSDTFSGMIYPPSSYYGSDAINGWSTTNNYLRFWYVNYDTITIRGEPKHGLWRWTEPDAELSFWWCGLGGVFEGTDGLRDEPDGARGQNGMREIIDRLALNPSDLGPLGQAAKLDNIALTLNRVTITDQMGASFWLNDGTSTNFDYNAYLPDEAEIYLFSAYYNFEDPLYPSMFGDTSDESFGENFCDSDDKSIAAGTCDSLVQTFVAAVLPASITESRVGLPTYGLHYGPLDEAPPCPLSCGTRECDCDLVLIDMLLKGHLDEDPLRLAQKDYYLPDWVLERGAV